MKKWKTVAFVALFAVLIAALTGCGSVAEQVKQDDVMILFTGCTNCAIATTDSRGQENVGFAGVAAYKKAMQKKTPHVSLVDCGDAIQGDIIGSVSKGSYIIDIMNEVGYDYSALGNHEFAYGIPNLVSLLKKAKAKYVAANVTYTGNGSNPLSAVKPYILKTYGQIKIAYLGITTPQTMSSATPGYFMEDGKYVYDFAGGNDGKNLYKKVQSAVDDAKKAGATYVVAITHLGWGDDDAGVYGADKVVENTNGIDIVLDGNSREEVADKKQANKDGKSITIASAGRQLNAVGRVTITGDGKVKTEIVKPLVKDTATQDVIERIEQENEEFLNEQVATASTTLTAMSVVFGETGNTTNWLVRQKEMPIGDLCADAFRQIGGAQIAMVNGGGIRANIEKGPITRKDLISVLAFGNTLCVAAVTGQQILDALEISVMSIGSENVFGGFQQVSGIRFTVNISIPSPVLVDDTTRTKTVGEGERRVQDVYVEKADGGYERIDPEKIYTLASTDYLIKNNGDGITSFQGCDLILDSTIPDYQVLMDYITESLHRIIPSRIDNSARITFLSGNGEENQTPEENNGEETDGEENNGEEQAEE